MEKNVGSKSLKDKVKEVFSKLRYTNIDVCLESGSKKGDGFIGLLIRALIYGEKNGTKEEIDTIVKCTPNEHKIHYLATCGFDIDKFCTFQELEKEIYQQAIFGLVVTIVTLPFRTSEQLWELHEVFAGNDPTDIDGAREREVGFGKQRKPVLRDKQRTALAIPSESRSRINQDFGGSF
ncbi:hypothetical protein EVAR_28045_1 [Eumeta japonica]|uniref:Uncharacterized protein n=1 Tax=Eumeta variegata TaxID=151549 RepID=A0A4C1W4L0_EUMVA|nr:hypothetical protein EVAR_28045_1 [Eumeta japonica]